ncbi:type I-C CRISPR-associated protein Cas8c/Csd1, partial [Eubacteriales bacterium OttesenSCG-928-K08]|nr:type I-C CRISPR-associated protein Cas8c/Csd1 [Eubacteriales bacterium OttesenSCG-928-K08]
MIVQALVKYYEALAARGEISKPGWCKERVSYALQLSQAGELIAIVPLLREEKRGNKSVLVPQVMSLPERVVKASGVKANFLCDSADYLLGLDIKGNAKRVLDSFAACKELHESVLKDCQSTAARALMQFFAQWDPTTASEHPVLTPYRDALAAVYIVFLVDGIYAHEDAAIMAAWDAHYADDSEAQPILCSITGIKTVPVELHGKIKLRGGQPAGSNLVSFNATAFESYAKAGNENAAFGKYAAFAYTTALNYLLATEGCHQMIDEDTMVYWAEDADPALQAGFTMMTSPKEEDGDKLAAIMQKLAAGEAIAEDVNMESRFYVLCLSPNAARISVRFFLQDTFGNMMQNLRAHYARMQIIHAPYEREHLSINMLLQELANPNSREKKPPKPIAGAVLRSILTGARYPQTLYSTTLMRVRAEQDNAERRIKKISYGRAAIIKAYLLHNTSICKEELTVALNETNDNPAYVLGRLFAVLENTQEAANPTINTTIKDKYFTSACTTPKSVFPTLLRLSHAHVGKLEKRLAVYFEKEKGQLMEKLSGDETAFPAQLDLNGQGQFILGYYHQVQARYTKKEE